jgi:hypothetical protein
MILNYKNNMEKITIHEGTPPYPKSQKPKYQFLVDDLNQVSDGYHTIQELYDHRIGLFITLCKTIFDYSLLANSEFNVEIIHPWRSKYHSDGELSFSGEWFVLGIGKEKGKQITYHLPMSRWDETNFAETLDRAPEWDGHTSADVLERLKNL